MKQVKYCGGCDTTKPISEFYKNISTKDGLHYACMACHREHARKYEKSDKGKKTVRKKVNKMRILHRVKWEAGATLRYAVKTGKIIKPEICENCGRKTKLQGHHPDYSKPLSVLWFCGPCHKLAHGKLRDKGLIAKEQP